MIHTRLFLSHSSIDKPFVKKLAGDLEAFAGHSWVDIWELKVGDSLKDMFSKAISENDYFAIVLSPKSVASPWVKYELSKARQKELEKQNVFILPIIIENCDIPPQIKNKKYADFRKDYDTGLIGVLKSIFAKDKNRYMQIDGGFLGVHTKIADILLSRLDKAENTIKLNATFYPLFTMPGAILSITNSIENRDCKYNIIIQDHKSKHIEQITKVVRSNYTKNQFCNEIRAHVKIFLDLKKKYPKNVEIKYTDTFPLFPMVIMDSRVFVGFYSFAMPAPSGLWIEFSLSGTFCEQYVKHFNKLWDSGSIISV